MLNSLFNKAEVHQGYWKNYLLHAHLRCYFFRKNLTKCSAKNFKCKFMLIEVYLEPRLTSMTKRF